MREAKKALVKFNIWIQELSPELYKKHYRNIRAIQKELEREVLNL